MGGASKLLMLLSTPFPRPVTFRLSRHAKLGLNSLQHLHSNHQSTLSSPLTRPRSSRVFIHTQAYQDRDENGRPQPFESVSVGGGGGAWPEWVRLVEYVREERFGNGGAMVGVDGGDDSFSGSERLPENFVKEAVGCLAFARARPELFRLLSKKDIQVVVENGSPFLFKNALNSSRRMRLFLDGQESSVLNNEKPQTIDLMRYLLGYVYNYVSSWENSSSGSDLVETSVRNLFSQLASANGTSQPSNFTESYNNDPVSFEQSSRHFKQKLEMKRGDWVCPKCAFMNYARNMKCLECEEARPRRQLTGGEWECPQCDFFNYGRNMACLRCDCKRPEGALSSTPSSGFGHGTSTNFEEVYPGSNNNKSEIERRLAENDEKAERWFSKVSQLGDTSDLSSVIADEDFPEIMPLRKGVNRFVVSTRKTPLERRLANDQYKRNSVDGTTEGNETVAGTESSFSKTLDRILGQSSVSQGKNNTSSSQSGNSSSTARRDPSSVPFVPLPADMFRKSQAEGQQQPQNTISTSDNGYSSGTPKSRQSIEASISEGSDNLTESKREDLGTSISEDNFPDIMPMRKGENRFVISKKKDRSLTSPQYKRRLAMEQANNSNFVPFVPFPPGYFAKKETQSEFGNSTTKTELKSIAPAMSEKVPTSIDNSSETKATTVSLNDQRQQIVDGVISEQFEKKWDNNKVNLVPEKGNSPTSWGDNSWNNKVSFQENDSGRVNESGNSNHTWNNNCGSWDGRSPSLGSNLSAVSTAGNSAPSLNNNNESWRSESARGGNYGNETSSLPSWNNNGVEQNSRPSPGSNPYPMRSSEKTNHASTNAQTAKQSWGGGFSGKSLEGSAVTEPDPLDMSEEAKAQRWFRRVAQIKDISELSNIPDEDFPEIMPMRKGVNRFVVSKRKTPLERRLTSPQYRKNLPIVRSEPEKDSNQSNS